MADTLTLEGIQARVNQVADQMEAGDTEVIFGKSAPPKDVVHFVMDVLVANSGMDHADIDALIHVAAYVLIQGRARHGSH
ncbi:MAG: hypothetical protein Q8S32_17280 [Burkholderiaceae bacterium]|nr:hypothetical protein [Burkholderiaceae bacterium]